MEQCLSLVTLGVADLDRARRFYEALGWTPASASVPAKVWFFQLPGMGLALWHRAALTEDAGVPDGTLRIGRPA